ncbi:MAG: hypothetical protein DCF15_12115 [Phormidesmis priestleyi]|uniref:Uncharacterized protein n=1 Tax=Phormidesmis priestleyi TaxID=268141 RepID=A0A2W4Z728_9CYAN|nr:MAG: hypothetical protein DCF15_12115 [Phormidesmis priestleyi]
MMTAFKKSELAESDRAIACSSATVRYGLTTTTGHRLTLRHRLLLSPKYRLLPSIAAYGSSEFQPRIASARGLSERFGSAIAGGEVWLWAFYRS